MISSLLNQAYYSPQTFNCCWCYYRCGISIQPHAHKTSKTNSVRLLSLSHSLSLFTKPISVCHCLSLFTEQKKLCSNFKIHVKSRATSPFRFSTTHTSVQMSKFSRLSRGSLYFSLSLSCLPRMQCKNPTDRKPLPSSSSSSSSSRQIFFPFFFFACEKLFLMRQASSPLSCNFFFAGYILAQKNIYINLKLLKSCAFEISGSLIFNQIWRKIARF